MLYVKYLPTGLSSGGGGGSSAPINSRATLSGFSNSWGSVGTAIMRWNTSVVIGSDITYTSSATDGDSLTLLTAGIYCLVYYFSPGASDDHLAISLNQTDLTDTAPSLPADQRLANAYGGNAIPDPANSATITMVSTRYFAANSIIRTLSDKDRSNDPTIPRIEVTRIS